MTYDDWKNDFPEQEYEEPFESDNLIECLDYLVQFKDEEPLFYAITNQNTIIENALSELQFLIDVMASTNNVFVKNRLLELRNKLKSNQ